MSGSLPPDSRQLSLWCEKHTVDPSWGAPLYSPWETWGNPLLAVGLEPFLTNWGHHIAPSHPGQIRITSICCSRTPSSTRGMRGTSGNTGLLDPSSSPGHRLLFTWNFAPKSCTWEPDDSHWTRRHPGWARLVVSSKSSKTDGDSLKSHLCSLCLLRKSSSVFSYVEIHRGRWRVRFLLMAWHHNRWLSLHKEREWVLPIFLM